MHNFIVHPPYQLGFVFLYSQAAFSDFLLSSIYRPYYLLVSFQMPISR